MCQLGNVSTLVIHDVHGGTAEKDIDSKLHDAVYAAQDRPTDAVVIFFDEINTADCMGYFKMIVCDRQWSGGELPSNLLVIAACNPFRLKTEAVDALGADVGLRAIVGGSGTGFKRTQLEYLVHPLPLSMASCAYDYGALGKSEERKYILQMVQSCKKSSDASASLFSSREQDAVVDALAFGQEFLREKKGTPGHPKRSATSLREVGRFLQIVSFFRERYYVLWNDAIKRETRLYGHSYKVTPKDVKEKSLLLAFAHCYAVQLSQKERRQYWLGLRSKWAVECILPRHPYGDDYPTQVNHIQKDLLGKFVLPDEIVLNHALCENVFTMITCIFNRLPLIIVGQPGSSKTLAMRLIRDNFSQNSKAKFFSRWDSVEVVPFQCSPLSRAEGIERTFILAQKKQKLAQDSSRNIICVVLLDEVGLAEQSPHRPLKVLHRLLEPTHEERENQVACIGLSNWRLDQASMNRTTFLFRVPPTCEELARFTSGIVGEGMLVHIKWGWSPKGAISLLLLYFFIDRSRLTGLSLAPLSFHPSNLRFFPRDCFGVSKGGGTSER
jgi:hypothetical protein